MKQNNRTNEKTFLSTIKQPIANNLQNICKISPVLCRLIYDKLKISMTPSKRNWKKINTLQHLLLLE